MSRQEPEWKTTVRVLEQQRDDALASAIAAKGAAFVDAVNAADDATTPKTEGEKP